MSNKRRIPFDIQFLMESILSEDPDSVYIDEEDAEILNSKGARVEDMEGNWEDGDAIPFYIDTKDNVIVFCEMNTHGRIERGLDKAASIARNKLEFDAGFLETNLRNCAGISSILLPTSELYFYGLKDNTREGIRQYLAKNRKRFRYLSIRGGESVELSGRMWTGYNVISFWNNKADIVPYINLIEGFMSTLTLRPKVFAYEFIDSDTMYAYNELNQAVKSDEKLTAAQIQDKLAKKHLKKSKSDYGPEFWERSGKKAAKGFDIAAKADAAIPALEGHIKLKDLLKENPDFVRSETDGKRIAEYFDGDAIAFFAYPQFSILNRGGVHYDIMNAFQNVHSDFKNYSSNPADVEYLIDEKGLIVSSADGLIDAIESGPLGAYLDDHNPFDDGDGDGTDGGEDDSPQKGEFRTKSGGLAGRIWTKKKIISFWNKKEDVIKRWNEVEKMFTDLAGMLGNLDDYRVDWLERDASISTPLTPASEVSSAKASDKQEDFLNKLFGDKKISDEEIKKLQARLHTLPPKKKREMLMQMGYKNVKAAEIASKLGMTVAQFNHIMNVNEGDE